MMFAIDDGHSQSVGWIAGRNALFVCFFVLATLSVQGRSDCGPCWPKPEMER